MNAYGDHANAFLNVREAAKEPWRGITAYVQGQPHLVIDKNGNKFVIESEDGSTSELELFERWVPATEQSRLVAASRVNGSPFVNGAHVGSWPVGNLVYFNKEWSVRAGDSLLALPLERMINDFDRNKWSKTTIADLVNTVYQRGDKVLNVFTGEEGVIGDRDDSGLYWVDWDDGDYSPVEAHNIEPANDLSDSDLDFLSHRDFYDFGVEASVIKVADTFNYELPPHGIHFRTFAAMKQAGLSARVTLPPSPSYPDGLVLQVPGPQGMDAMGWLMDFPGTIPPGTIATVETDDDPAQVTALFDTLGGKTAKVAEVGEPDTVDTNKKALTCPNCGSHTLRAFPPEKGQTTIACLTCGYQFEREVMHNPEASVKEALNYPTDPASRAQIIGIMQQITQASASGNQQLVQQLQQQLEQLLGNSNPNMPLQSSLTKEAPGNKHLPYATPKRNRQYEHILKSCRDEHPDWSEDRCKELAARTVNKQREEKGETKSSVDDDCGCGGNKEAGLFNRSPLDSPRMRTFHQDYGDMMEKAWNLYQEYLATAQANGEQPLSFDEWLNDERSAKTAADGKYTPGTRVEVNHPNLKGRGSILECGGKNESLGEEHYVIQMDNGDKVEEIPESAFKRIKSSHVNNDNLPDTPSQYFLESLEASFESVAAQPYDDISDPYSAPQQENLDDYTQSDPMDDDEGDFDYAHCPACDGPGVLLGQIGPNIYYRCRNCGLDFWRKNDQSSDAYDGAEAPDAAPDQRYPLASLDAAKEVNKTTLKAFKDSSGNPLEAGKLYVLHHPTYKVPDVVKILNLEENRIEAAIASDTEGSFPIHIKNTDTYSFDPYEQKTASGWTVESRYNFTSQEQRDLINENIDGRARNFDKLDLSNTHYQLKEESCDPNFLWGV